MTGINLRDSNGQLLTDPQIVTGQGYSKDQHNFNNYAGYAANNQIQISSQGISIYPSALGGVRTALFNGSGVHLYNASSQLLVRLSQYGLENFNSSQSVVNRMTLDGFENLNASGQLVNRLSQTGLETYNPTGQRVQLVDATGLSSYDSSGNLKARTGNISGLRKGAKRMSCPMFRVRRYYSLSNSGTVVRHSVVI